MFFDTNKESTGPVELVLLLHHALQAFLVQLPLQLRVSGRWNDDVFGKLEAARELLAAQFTIAHAGLQTRVARMSSEIAMTHSKHSQAI